MSKRQQYFFMVESHPTLTESRIQQDMVTKCSGIITFLDDIVSTSVILDHVESVEHDFLRPEIIVTTLNKV